MYYWTERIQRCLTSEMTYQLSSILDANLVHLMSTRTAHRLESFHFASYPLEMHWTVATVSAASIVLCWWHDVQLIPRTKHPKWSLCSPHQWRIRCENVDILSIYLNFYFTWSKWHIAECLVLYSPNSMFFRETNSSWQSTLRFLRWTSLRANTARSSFFQNLQIHSCCKSMQINRSTQNSHLNVSEQLLFSFPYFKRLFVFPQFHQMLTLHMNEYENLCKISVTKEFIHKAYNCFCYRKFYFQNKHRSNLKMREE